MAKFEHLRHKPASQRLEPIPFVFGAGAAS